MEIVKRTITIKPVKRIKFSGQTHYDNTGTVFEGAQLSKSGYKTGLTKKEEVDFCEELGLPKGTLSKNNADFWGTLLNLRLNNGKPYFLHIDSLMDEIKVRCLLENSKIAKNEIELKKMPLAEFYVEDAEAKAKSEEVIINHKMAAMDALRELTIEDKKGYLRLYGKRGLDMVSDSVVVANLFKEVDVDPVRFLNFYNNPDISLRISIEEMVEAGTLLKKGQYYYFENEVIGNSVDSVIAFFKDLKNQSLKIAAEAATKKKKK
jgi:hypothetical protein